MSPRFFRMLLAVSLGGLAPARAEDPTPAPKPPPYVLKNRSTFSATGDQRAPFWPIGWVKRQPMQTTSEEPIHIVAVPKVLLDEKSFRLTSILLGNPSLAIINGRTYSEGEFMRVPKSAPAATATAATAPAVALPPGVRIRVYRINDGNVVLQNQDQLITVNLQRPELVQRSAAEDLLTEDRP
jgi:hypothetical protein